MMLWRPSGCHALKCFLKHLHVQNDTMTDNFPATLVTSFFHSKTYKGPELFTAPHIITIYISTFISTFYDLHIFHIAFHNCKIEKGEIYRKYAAAPYLCHCLNFFP